MNVDRQVCLWFWWKMCALVNRSLHTAGTSHMGIIVELIIINNSFAYFLSFEISFVKSFSLGNTWYSTWSRSLWQKAFEVPWWRLGSLAKSINILVNLLNPFHYDTNDDGIGFGGWFKKDKHFCMDVYFVMSNILLKNSNDVTGSGIVIKLKLGVCYLMGWTKICHCTSMRISWKYSIKR